MNCNLSMKAIHFVDSVYNSGKHCPIAKAMNDAIDSNLYTCKEGLQFAVIIEKEGGRQHVLHHQPYSFEMYLIDKASANCSDNLSKSIRVIDIPGLEKYLK